MPILQVLDEIPDPRGYNVVHDLTDVLFVAFAAMLCGAANCTEMAMFAEGRLALLRQFVPLEGGAPSHDTFSRVVQGQLAVDGKSLRRAYEKGHAHMPPLVVSVLECETFMSLAQTIAGDGGEAEAAIAALKLLSLKGCTVSADALHCHRRFTQTVVDGGGGYVLTLKGNQSKLAREAATALDVAAANPRTAIAETEDTRHGRQELRRAIVTAFRQSPSKAALVGLKAVARVEVWRTDKGVTSHEVRTYALSRIMTPSEVLAAVRGHWAIENRLHWQLDVLMAEDQARNRKDNAPANLASFRRLALNVLRADQRTIPLSHKRLKARWNDQELLSLMTHVR
jgi:predicted transposase YbfD/YdcC